MCHAESLPHIIILLILNLCSQHVAVVVMMWQVTILVVWYHSFSRPTEEHFHIHKVNQLWNIYLYSYVHSV